MSPSRSDPDVCWPNWGRGRTGGRKLASGHRCSPAGADDESPEGPERSALTRCPHLLPGDISALQKGDILALG